MHVGMSGHAFGHVNRMHHHMHQEPDQTRGERIVARLDSNNDGALEISELEGTRLGRKMTVDRFSRIDGNSDGMLDAGEIDAARRGRGGRGAEENAIISQVADRLAERIGGGVEDGIAARIMDRLDADGSGALNSEEIAGTRLYQAIGNGFFGLDGDGNGALDTGELSNFLVGYLTGSGSDPEPMPDEPGDVSSPAAPVGAETVDDSITAMPEEVADIAPPAPITPDEPDQTADTAEPPAPDPVASAAPSGDAAPSTGAQYAMDIKAAFEAALEVLQSGSGDVSPYDVVNNLYGEVQSILNA